MTPIESRLAVVERQLRSHLTVVGGLSLIILLVASITHAQPLFTVTKLEFLELPERFQVLYVAGAIDGMSFIFYGYSPKNSEKLRECIGKKPLGQITMEVTQRVRIATVLGDVDSSIASDMAKYFGSMCPLIELHAQPLEESYWSRLDAWVLENMGRVRQRLEVVGIQQMAETCGKLVILRASELEKINFSTTNREEFDFRIDVCVKLTAQRVSSQPEFQNQTTVRVICVETQKTIFKELCRRAKLIH